MEGNNAHRKTPVKYLPKRVYKIITKYQDTNPESIYLGVGPIELVGLAK